MQSLEWMAWTGPTAAFFLVILLLVCAVSWMQMHHPRPARRGWLPMATTPGDRLFVALLASAYLHAIWLAGVPDSWPAWPATALAVLLGCVLMRSG